VRNIEFEDETEEGLEKQVNIQFCKELKQELKLQGFEVRDARCADLSKKTLRGFMFFFFFLGDYYISRVRAEHASAPLRSRTRTTHWW
jgi:hypothetical protein